MNDKYDIWKTLTVIGLATFFGWALSGCASTEQGPRAANVNDPCPGVDQQEWHDGSKLGRKSSRNTECRSTARTREVLRNAGYQVN